MQQILDEIEGKIEELRSTKESVLVAIDGRCAAGKTTLANELARRVKGTVFHMDDYFLRPEQRTEARMNEPGGNVDYERFRSEILELLAEGERQIVYQPFDCKSGKLMSKCSILRTPVCIIEGAYSCHPTLRDFYDCRFFLSVKPEEQTKRIQKRNGEEVAKVFANKWIPLEERYFKTYSVSESCDCSYENN